MSLALASDRSYHSEASRSLGGSSMRAPDSHNVESSSADEALSRALERERSEQPKVHYGDAPGVGRAASRSRRVAQAVILLTLLAATALFPALSAFLGTDSAAGEALISVLAALVGIAVGISTSWIIDRRSMVSDWHLQSKSTIGKGQEIALALKRMVDIALSSFGIIFLAPLLLMIAIALKLENPKAPAIFSQPRIGRRGMLFRLLKFRTVLVTVDGSLQIGPVGRVLRANALDELPQLINVLKGDMSLVGPRAIRPLE